MVEEREIKGEIEGFSNEPRKFGKGIGCRGIKIEDVWHNKVGKIEELEWLDKKFPRGTFVKFKEKKNKKGYWDIDGDIEVIDNVAAYDKIEHPKNPPVNNLVTTERNKDILLQVAFKGAIEIEIPHMEKTDVLDYDEVIKEIINSTKSLYKGMIKVKEDLQEEGVW